MNDDDRDLREVCRAAREWIHARIDGDLSEDRAALLDAHLRACGDCREFESGLARVAAAFAGLPQTSFPDDALREVFAATVDVRPWWRRWTALGPMARPALVGVAAAAVAGVALWLATAGRPGGRPGGGPTEAEVARAMAETRYALALASSAMRRSERAVIQDVLRDEVAPALDRVPVRWPGEAARRDGA